MRASNLSASKAVKAAARAITAVPYCDYTAVTARFLAALDVRQSSRQTYGRGVRQFLLWLNAQGKTVKETTREDIILYKERLAARGLSPLTIGSYLQCVRTFYEWLEANLIATDVAKGIKSPRKRPAFKKSHLTDYQCAQLLAWSRAHQSKRDYAIINLLVRSGLRTIELCRLNIEDIVTEMGRKVARVWGKGRDEKDEPVIITSKGYEPIGDYLAGRGPARPCEPLFKSESHNSKDGRLTTRAIRAIVSEAFKAIGLDSREFTAHSLRHTAACAMLRHGASLADVQLVLRHASPTTTQIYVESIKRERQLMNAAEDLLDNAF